MAEDYRHRLFASYNTTHASHLDADDLAKRDWFISYAIKNYVSHLKHLDPDSARILELPVIKGICWLRCNRWASEPCTVSTSHLST